jgi:hypothetical protein
MARLFLHPATKLVAANLVFAPKSRPDISSFDRPRARGYTHMQLL